MKTSSSRRSSGVQPRVKVWLEKENDYAFGWGVSTILKAVDETGSIKEAARVVGKSYRHIWSRLKSAESTLGIVLVETRVGGEGTNRSRLTKSAKLLVAEYDRLRRDVMQLVERRFAGKLAEITKSFPERAAGGNDHAS